MIDFTLKVKGQGQMSNKGPKMTKFQSAVTPPILIVESPNENQNVRLGKLFPKNNMRQNIRLPVLALEGVMLIFSFSSITQKVFSLFSPNKN